MGTPNVRWAGRTNPLIVEVAEALACPTDLVAAVGKNIPTLGDVIVATFTPDYPGDETVYGARLQRDDGGVLHEIGRAKLADSLADLLNGMEEVD